MAPSQQEPAVLLELAASEELKNNMYISVNLQDGDKVKKVKDMREKKAAQAKEKTEQASRPRLSTLLQLGWRT